MVQLCRRSWEIRSGIDRSGSDLVIADDDRRMILARVCLNGVDVAFEKKSTQKRRPGVDSVGVQQVDASCAIEANDNECDGLTGQEKKVQRRRDPLRRPCKTWDLTMADPCGFFSLPGPLFWASKSREMTA